MIGEPCGICEACTAPGTDNEQLSGFITWDALIAMCECPHRARYELRTARDQMDEHVQIDGHPAAYALRKVARELGHSIAAGLLAQSEVEATLLDLGVDYRVPAAEAAAEIRLGFREAGVSSSDAGGQ